MKNKYLLVALIFTAVNIGGCAATEDDSDSDQTPLGSSPSGTQATVPIASVSDQKSALTNQARPDGWLWMFSPLSKSNTNKFKCFIQDGLHTDQFQAIGQSIIYGAAIGILIRLSGRPFFGRWKKDHEPMNPEPPTTPDQDFWFWHWAQKNVKSPLLGALQGGGLGLSCQVALTGWSGIGFPGLLGANFESAATSLYLGILSSSAASPLVKSWFGEAQPEKWKVLTQEGGEPPAPPANWLDRVSDAFHANGYGKIIRYNLAPRMTLFFLGSGVAIAVYRGLQDDPTSANSTLKECDQIRKIEPWQTYQLNVPPKNSIVAAP